MNLQANIINVNGRDLRRGCGVCGLSIVCLSKACSKKAASSEIQVLKVDMAAADQVEHDAGNLGDGQV